MQATDAALVTSIYYKTGSHVQPDDEECYYLVTRDGLFIGRNNSCFQSLVPAPAGPGELETQQPFVRLNYPKVPADLLGRIVGFFWTVACRYGAEAIVLLGLDRRRETIVPIVPHQLGTIGRGYGGAPYPIGLHYEIPPMPPGLTLIGDIHSHAFDPAYASKTDIADVRHWPGLHVVAGRLDVDPPQWYAEFVVDGARFPVAAEASLDVSAYQGRVGNFDRGWLDRLRVQTRQQHYDNHTQEKPAR